MARVVFQATIRAPYSALGGETTQYSGARMASMVGGGQNQDRDLPAARRRAVIVIVSIIGGQTGSSTVVCAIIIKVRLGPSGFPVGANRLLAHTAQPAPSRRFVLQRESIVFCNFCCSCETDAVADEDERDFSTKGPVITL